MEFKIKEEQIIEKIEKKLRTNQVLLSCSVAVALGVTMWNMDYVYWGFYFSLISALTLPNINKSKQHLSDYKNNKLETIEGKVIDYFPKNSETDSNGDVILTDWFLWVQKDGLKIAEFATPERLDIERNSEVKVAFLNGFEVPISINVTKEPENIVSTETIQA